MTRPTTPDHASPVRSPAQRKTDTLELLSTQRHTWLSTTGPNGAHLIPLRCVWAAGRLVMSTGPTSRTARNLTRIPKARAALGTPLDVVLCDGSVAVLPPDRLPAEVAERLGDEQPARWRAPDRVYLVLTPDRISAWRHRAEIPHRVVMSGGEWSA